MRTIRLGILVGGLMTPVLLGALSLSGELGVVGSIVGLATGWAATALMAASRARSETAAIFPADWITLTRAVLTAGAAGLVADSSDGSLRTAALLTLSCVALALDGVDGAVARRTGTATALGGRFDGEVDAFLILVLSIQASREFGAWVLAIGAARYAFLVAGWLVRWLAAPLPPRYWRKVVTAVQGIVLTVAISGLPPRELGMVAVGAALLLLMESFGRDVIWLYRTGGGPATRQAMRGAVTLVAALTLWAGLVVPDRLDRLTPASFARIPIEGLVLAVIGLVLPHRPRRAVALVAGFVFGILTVLKILDMGFYAQLGRPFDPVLDWSSLSPGIGVLRNSIGAPATDVLVLLVGFNLLLLIAAVTASTVRVTSVAARHQRASARGIAVLGVVWVVSAALSLQLGPGAPIASMNAAGLAVTQVRDAVAAARDQHSFGGAILSADPYAQLSDANLLTSLRGKDVVIAFVESYGQAAVQGTTFSPAVDDVLRNGTATLAAGGYSTRSAFLTSPTFGSGSWFAHSTLQSGLWVNDQQRYDQLMQSNRFTLSDAFGKAGWRTVGFFPADTGPWPEGRSFYHYDKLYNRHNVGYQGPTFSWASMPDQYALAAFQQLEFTPGHRPLMAEVDLVSSHYPWTPLPHMVPSYLLGNGSFFDPMPAKGLPPAVAWRNADTVRQLYGQSIEYSLHALISWVTGLHDPNLVLVLLGDHQPTATVSGDNANHEVPISIVAHDPAVLAQIAPWRWEDGLLPSSAAPVWPMDAFRNRFLDAFSTTSAAVAQQPSR